MVFGSDGITPNSNLTGPNNTYIYIYIYIHMGLLILEKTYTYIYRLRPQSKQGARGVVVIAVGNEHGDTSSNPGRDWLHFT